jgi:VanZ family protein
MSSQVLPTAPPPHRFERWLVPIALAYSVFVLYGSLVPLEARTLELGEAVSRFAQIPYLSLDTIARADWVANILLYIPLAFIWCASLHRQGPTRPLATGFVLVSCVTFAVLIEFLQQWFPPRTMSQNDLLAEGLGSLIGVVLWLVAGRQLIDLVRTIARGGQAGLGGALIAYFFVIFVYSLMPMDFLVSGQELTRKLSSDAISLTVGPSCGGLLRCGLNLTLETASFVPFGIFIALLARKLGAAPGALTGLLLGAMAGAAIEGLQIVIASGITQGVSIATRAVGMMVGILIGRAWSAAWLTALLPIARAMVGLGLLAYAVLFAAIAWRGGWQIDGALARLGDQYWLPFYYHYYTTEQEALASLLRNIVLYAPIGIAVWIWQFAGLGGRRTDLPGGTLVFWLGAVLAMVMEICRLLKPLGHGDPTNILIGAVAAWMAFHLTAWFAACLLDSPGKSAAEPRRSFLRT